MYADSALTDTTSASPAPGLRSLYLGLRDLDEVDAKRLEVFLRFAGRTARYEWKIAQEQAEDLVICALPVDDSTAPMPLESLPAARTTWIVSRGQESPESGAHLLVRPIEIEAFADVLRAREAQIDRVAAYQAPTRQPHVETAAPMTARPTHSPRALQPAAAAPEPLPQLDESLASHAYRLARWPAPDLMRGRPKFVRALGFLSHRPLDLERLVVLSGVDRSTCLELLGLLHQRRLLIAVEAPETPTRPIVHAAALPAVADTAPRAATRAAATEATPTTSSQGLFQRLRRRLGLGA
ncbi:MAG TPA: hypothetical protein VH328_03410 [Burkholderiaceae bacterium]|nr:hypothetical protein [Burkholderiaceae bacterium]